MPTDLVDFVVEEKKKEETTKSNNGIKQWFGQISVITPVFDIIWSSPLWIFRDAPLAALCVCVRCIHVAMSLVFD